MSARIAAAIEVLRGGNRVDVVAHGAGREELRTVRMGEWEFTPEEFVLNWAVPNFFFHLQTGYAILSMHGVGLGKGIILGDSCRWEEVVVGGRS